MDEVKAMAQAGESVGKAVRTIRRNATEQAHKGASVAEHMLAEVDELVKQSRKTRRKARKDAAKMTKKVTEQTRKRGRKARKQARATTAEFSRKVQKKLSKLEHKTDKVRRRAEKNPGGKRGGRRLLWLLGAGSVAAVAVVVVKSRQSAPAEVTAPVIPLGGETQSTNGSAPSNAPHAAEKN